MCQGIWKYLLWKKSQGCSVGKRQSSPFYLHFGLLPFACSSVPDHSHICTNSRVRRDRQRAAKKEKSRRSIDTHHLLCNGSWRPSEDNTDFYFPNNRSISCSAFFPADFIIRRNFLVFTSIRRTSYPLKLICSSSVNEPSSTMRKRRTPCFCTANS